MVKPILLSACLFCCGTVYAESGSLVFDVLQETAGVQSGRVENPNAPIKVSYLPQNIYWGHSSEELYDDGAMSFEYAGKKYSIKLGFERGTYDSYINNYKTIPTVILSETNAVYLVYKVSDLQSGREWLNFGKPDEMAISASRTNIFIRDSSGGDVAVFDYSVLRSTWAQNALRYRKDSFGPTIKYFVPQTKWDGAKFHYGYVVSEQNPYYPNSGLPLDFVELYQYNPVNAEYSYKPISYSIPLGLVFKVAYNGKGRYWVLDELRPADLQDALADELKGRASFNAPRGIHGGAATVK